MNQKTRIKLEAAEHDVPQTLDEVNAAVAEVGRCQRERTQIQKLMNDALVDVRTSYEAAAKPYAERIAGLTKGVATYCEAHRDELTKGGKTKTAKLATGEVSWRMRPPSVNVRGLATVLDLLKRLKLDRFIRVKEEIDKDAILAERNAIDGIKGLSISQKEDFVIKPDSTELEEVR